MGSNKGRTSNIQHVLHINGVVTSVLHTLKINSGILGCVGHFCSSIFCVKAGGFRTECSKIVFHWSVWWFACDGIDKIITQNIDPMLLAFPAQPKILGDGNIVVRIVWHFDVVYENCKWLRSVLYQEVFKTLRLITPLEGTAYLVRGLIFITGLMAVTIGLFRLEK